MVPVRFDAIYTRLFFRDAPYFLCMSGALAVHFLLWAFVGLGLNTFRPSDTEYITLHYKIIFGTDFIARWESILLIPALGAFILICNGSVGRSMIRTNRARARAFAAVALCANVVLLLSLYLLYRVNR